MNAIDRVPNLHIGAAVTTVLSASAVSWWFHAGPWAWVTDLQIAWLGAVAPFITVMSTIGIGLALTLVPLTLWHTHRQTPPETRWKIDWMQTPSGKATLVGLMLFGVALWQVAEGLRAGDLVDVSIEGLATTQARYVRVPTDEADFNLAIGLDRDWYVPVVRDAQVVAVFSVSPLEEPTWSDLEPGDGMFTAFGLPGAVIGVWRDQGLQVATHVPVIDVEGSPQRAWFMAVFLGAIGLPALVGGAYFVRRA